MPFELTLNSLVVAVVLLLAIVVFVMWRIANRAIGERLVARYYHGAYHPSEIKPDDPGAYPPRNHVRNVPWLSTREPFCQATSLRMLAAQRGSVPALDEVSFLMGFTYGAARQTDGEGFLPFGDPEPGFAAAAPYLGLTSRYFVTSDQELFLRSLRFWLSRGRAIRLPLDAAVLYKRPGSLPHCEVLVGYDEKGFYFYEPVSGVGGPAEPGELPPGEDGLFVKEELLMQAVARLSRVFRYPWQYACTVCEDGPRAEEMGPIWQRNGGLLVGGARFGPPQGADAIQAAAAQVSDRGDHVRVLPLRQGLKLATATRRANAAYLRARFPGDETLGEAAAAFDRAAELYDGSVALLLQEKIGHDESDSIATWLNQAAAWERKAGRLLLDRAREPTSVPAQA